MSGCSCLTEPAPLQGEIFSVWEGGLSVTMDDWVWKRLKSHLERLGADVIEHHVNSDTTTRTFKTKPGPKVGTKYAKSPALPKLSARPRAPRH